MSDTQRADETDSCRVTDVKKGHACVDVCVGIIDKRLPRKTSTTQAKRSNSAKTCLIFMFQEQAVMLAR